MKTVIAAMLLMSGLSAQAQTIKMNYVNEDLEKIISEYSKATGQRFVVDPAVRGKISIFVPDLVSKDEAFNHLSTALMINGYAITTQNGVMVVRTARNAQRDLLDVVTELPPVAPAKMITWVYTPKHISAVEINRELRLLQSKDGELSIYSPTNSIIFSDYTPNLHRVAALLQTIDKPADPAAKKLIEQSRKREEDRHKMHARKGGPALSGPKGPGSEGEDSVLPPPPPPHHGAPAPAKKGK